MKVTSYYSSPIGKLKLTATNEHVTSILFCDDEVKDDPNETSQLLTICMIQLEEYFAGTRTSFDLPLQPRGTTFQNNIWEQLRVVPYGKTISYSELAKRFGDIKAIRAVAAANSKNDLCIVIPCHRVIGKNGTLTGYSGGLWRKEWLLQHEAKNVSGLQQLLLEFNAYR